MTAVFGTKEKNVDYTMRKGIYGVTFNNGKEKVLAVRTPNGGYFLPGGGVEHDESNEICLRREMLEETGYSIDIKSFIGNASCYFLSLKGDPLLSNGYFYRVELLEKTQNPLEEGQIKEWVRIEKVEELFTHEHHIWAIKEGIHSAR
ncbi:NUDIX hydrolase [Ornithinibacillus halotolerans]|uniref:DNA mismatch repair protein MutT n=1 Tax=Ornithinibacillus halotolerans TaxID=1274357 RepID=A0A916S117_9BACI|nr:NUDIX domain-containing protein [Ornithinibacillus halotolerans]GGA78550.1 DNA mismatch repair protein MutT [Ornithinibacillus halotolerans]